MNILILNLILSTAEKGVIKRRDSIKDCMICNFARGFIANGHNVTIVASEEFQPLKDEKHAFDVIFMPSKLPKIFRPHLIPYPKGLRRYLKKNIDKFDLVVTSEAFAMATLLAADICKDKLVIWQEMSAHQKLLFKLPAKAWYNIITRFINKDQLIIPRSAPADKFVSHYSKNVSSEYVDHGANGDIFKPTDESGDYFIIVSRLVKGKNIIKMIDKFSDFIKNTKYTDYKLLIVGDGEEYSNIKNFIKESNLDESVTLHGYLTHDKFCKYLANAKAMLVDTIKDLNMVSIPEALISGTPIVSNTLPTTAKYIQENNLGVIRDDWDYNDLVKVVENYPEYHEECLRVRDELTSVGASRKMLDIYLKWVNKG